MRSSHWRWHLDEVFVKINGERHSLWRVVDHEGGVLESFVTKTQDKKAALKFLKKSLKRDGDADEFVTDRLHSYGAALGEFGIRDRQQTGRWMNNRAENSHQPFRRRERAMLRFRRMRTLQNFVAVHASIFNHLNQERSLYSRANFKRNCAAALAKWRGLCAEYRTAILPLRRRVLIGLTPPVGQIHDWQTCGAEAHTLDKPLVAPGRPLAGRLQARTRIFRGQFRVKVREDVMGRLPLAKLEVAIALQDQEVPRRTPR